jgi:short-subunit dehydrogenase
MKKIVLITGASSGIGQETALLLKISGYTVYGAARRIDRMKNLQEMGINVFKFDITDDNSINLCVNALINKEGQIDVLINNAGYGSFGALEDVPMSEAKRQFEVNLFGLGRLTQLVLPHMRARKSGTIVNITSVGGKMTTPFGGWYQASKYALESLSDSLRMDVQRFGINVVIIEPGAIESEWVSITKDNLMKASSTPYKDAATKLIDGLIKSYKNASHPSVIAKVILKALSVRNPKTRYVAGKQGKSTPLMKALLPDKRFDALLLKILS